MGPMRLKPIVTGALGALIFGMTPFLSIPGIAAPQSVAEIANYTGADRQAVLEAGAKKEGTVLVYTTGTQGQPVFDAFASKYPFVRLEIFRADGPVLARRLIEEYAAGRYIADTVGTTTGALHPLRDASLLQPMISPEHAMMIKEAIEPGRHWTIDYQSFVSLGYNTKAVSEREIPNTLDDLLNPKWQGKMAVSNDSTLPNWIGAVLHDKGDKGEDFLRKLAQQKIRVYDVSARAVANLVVSGEAPLSPVIFGSHMINSQAEGASVAWKALGEVYSNLSGAALLNKAPHPHAAMLYLDFLFSREGQSIRQKLCYASGRTDFEFPGKPTKILLLTEEPTYAQDFEKWSAFALAIFGRGASLPSAK